MKKNNITAPLKFSFWPLFALLLLGISGCARKVAFQTSAVVPAARGYTKIKKDNNSNYRIHVQLYNLAEIKRLEPGGQVYVVWMASAGGEPKNLGQISSGSSMLSKKLKATFETVSSTRPSEVFITAETDGGTTYPSATRVLTTGGF